MKLNNNRRRIRMAVMLLLTNILFLSTSCAQKSTSNKAPKAKTAESKLAFKDQPYLEKVFIDASPKDKKDDILIGELGLDGGNKDIILQLAQDIADGKYGNFDSFLIGHRGKLLFESYYRRGRIDLPHPQASATKSYTCLALGRAIQLGYLTMADLDKPLISFLKDLDPAKLVEGVEKITLNKVLTMCSGIRINQKRREKFEKRPRKLKGQGQVQTYLEHSAPITKTSQSFKYQFDPMLVMQVIEAVVPGSAEDFIKTELLDKLGITNYDWLADFSGFPRAGSGSSMTSRDMFKWGTLVINKGKWNGEQLVPDVFIARATSKIVDQSDEYDDLSNGVSGTAYGYYWWQADLSSGDKKYLSKAARGGSGQTIIVIEELDLLVVTTTHRDVDDPVAVTATRVLPAFIQNSDGITAGNSDGQSKFPPVDNRYLGQKTPGLTPELFAPGIVSTDDYVESGGNFSPDMQEFYFSRYGGEYKKPTLFVMKYENGEWSEPSIIPANIEHKYRDRFNPGWSEMKSLEHFKDIPVHGLSISAKGTYYIDHYTPEGDGPLRYSRLINGKHEAPKRADEVINTGKWVAHPYIAPDESYLLWDVEREGDYGADIYISFRQKDGSWGDGINMGKKINTGLYDQWPRVTPDGKYLFFWKGDEKVREDGSKYLVGSPYWVDAKIIDTLRPKK